RARATRHRSGGATAVAGCCDLPGPRRPDGAATCAPSSRRSPAPGRLRPPVAPPPDAGSEPLDPSGSGGHSCACCSPRWDGNDVWRHQLPPPVRGEQPLETSQLEPAGRTRLALRHRAAPAGPSTTRPGPAAVPGAGHGCLSSACARDRRMREGAGAGSPTPPQQAASYTARSSEHAVPRMSERFELVSPYSPAGDQPYAIEKLVE